ncbi:MAG TPA: ATP-dependent DNA helicase RecG [Candidatus Polarisedimenticolia bacterium]|nr:ATP-dependent DNA helicase RecG [Candidatus Polarisedimenticolia bacterium]
MRLKRVKEDRLRLSTPLSGVRGIGETRAAALAEAGLRRVEDLLLTLPMRYEDRGRCASIASLSCGDRATLRAQVEWLRIMGSRKRGFAVLEAELRDDTGSLLAAWYNQVYLRNLLKPGTEIVLYGEVGSSASRPGRLLLKNPQFEVLGEDPTGIHTGRIVPIYRKTAGLSTRSLRSLIHRILAALPLQLPETLPPFLSARPDLCPRGTAFREAHFPAPGTSQDQLEEKKTAAQRRLAMEELYRLQRSFARARRLRSRRRAVACPAPADLRDRLRRMCAFHLTVAQERALGEILADLERPFPMQRLLQGDVGSGKTIVALLAAVSAMEAGLQVAWMVPTEVLAQQQMRCTLELLRGTRFRAALLTSRTRESWEAGSGPDADLVVGTHSLIQESVQLVRLGLVVIDEQHRFGVRQRDRLERKGRDLHRLLMTATPIPRSLAHACYGDLDVSVIDELPPGRVPIRTVVRRDADRERIYRFIREEVARGGRAAFVLPAVQAGKAPERSAVAAREKLAASIFPDFKVGLLHGGLDPAAREQALREFAEGAAPVLVSTTVVEVGVDVPEASVIVVEQADRFGLSQLHQMRGRVGRGSRPSWCILIPTEGASPEALERIRILREVSDGFEIARRDLEMRGPGELRGLRQSGVPDLRVADLSRDLDLLEAARLAVSRVAMTDKDS